MARDRDADTSVAVDQGDDMIKVLEEERKASAGKDKKITELAHELKALREQIAGIEDQGEETVSETQRMVELAAALKAREEELSAKERAFTEATERGIPVSLALRGAKDWDNFLADLTAFEQKVRERKWTRKPVSGLTYGGQEKRPALTLDHLRRMSATEVGRLPDSVVMRLQEGS